MLTRILTLYADLSYLHGLESSTFREISVEFPDDAPQTASDSAAVDTLALFTKMDIPDLVPTTRFGQGSLINTEMWVEGITLAELKLLLVWCGVCGNFLTVGGGQFHFDFCHYRIQSKGKGRVDG